MNIQPYFVSFAVKDRFNNALQDAERARLGRAPGGQKKSLRERLSAVLQFGRSANLARADSSDGRAWRIDSSKPQEQCC